MARLPRLRLAELPRGTERHAWLDTAGRVRGLRFDTRPERAAAITGGQPPGCRSLTAKGGGLSAPLLGWKTQDWRRRLDVEMQEQRDWHDLLAQEDDVDLLARVLGGRVSGHSVTASPPTYERDVIGYLKLEKAMERVAEQSTAGELSAARKQVRSDLEARDRLMDTPVRDIIAAARETEYAKPVWVRLDPDPQDMREQAGAALDTARIRLIQAQKDLKEADEAYEQARQDQADAAAWEAS